MPLPMTLSSSLPWWNRRYHHMQCRALHCRGMTYISCPASYLVFPKNLPKRLPRHPSSLNYNCTKSTTQQYFVVYLANRVYNFWPIYYPKSVWFSFTVCRSVCHPAFGWSHALSILWSIYGQNFTNNPLLLNLWSYYQRWLVLEGSKSKAD